MSRRGAIALGLLAVLAAAFTLTRNRGGPWLTFGEDEVYYAEQARHFAVMVFELEPRYAAEVLTQSFRPPLLVVLDGVALLGMSEPVPRWLAAARLPWLWALVGLTYALARHLAHASNLDKRRGEVGALVAASLVGTSPAVLHLGSSLMSEVPLAAWSALTVLLALRSDGLRRHRVALGVVVGLGLMMKWTYPVAVGLPLVWLLFKRRTERATWTSLGVTLGVALLIAGPWYASALPLVVEFVGSVAVGEGARAFGAASRGPLEDALFYPLALTTAVLWLPMGLALLAGLVSYGTHPRHRRAMVLTSVLLPLLAWTLLANKEVRYIVPLLPLAAAAAGVGLAGLERFGARAATTLVVAGLLNAALQVPDEGPAPLVGSQQTAGPITVSWQAGAGLPGLPTAVELQTPAGRVALWTRSSRRFNSRYRVAQEVPLDALAAAVERELPADPRTVAVATPEVWLWTPLWERARARGRFGVFKSASCQPVAIKEAALIVALEPPGQQDHCAAELEQALDLLDELRPRLREVDSWEVDGRRLVLLARDEVLVPGQEAWTKLGL